MTPIFAGSNPAEVAITACKIRATGGDVLLRAHGDALGKIRDPRRNRKIIHPLREPPFAEYVMHSLVCRNFES